MNDNFNPDLSGKGTPVRQSSDDIREWSLRPVWRAALFLAAVTAFSLWMCWQAGRAAWVSYRMDSLTPAEIQAAMRLDPGNPDLVHRLGLLLSSDPSGPNLPEALKYLRQSIDMSPRRWDYWFDLGTSCDFAGDTACSDAAFDKARQLNPMTPALQWAIANHYLLTNRPEKSFPYFRRLLDLAPSYLDNTLRLCIRATHDSQAIYSQVLPHGPDPSPRFDFLMFLSAAADYEGAMKIWGQMITGPDRSPELSMVKPFLDFLLDHNQIDDASTVWNDLQHAGVIPVDSTPQSANLLYNGGFEGPLLNTGFDWRMSDSSDLAFDVPDSSAAQGTKCLRIDFPVGRNAEYVLVSQVVRIKPNTHYQLTASVRSNNLTSDSGPQLRVVEVGCQACPIRTSDMTTGSTPWHQVSVDFTTQPQTQAVNVSFWRAPDQAGKRDITGTVWLDGVVLQAVETPDTHPTAERAR